MNATLPNFSENVASAGSGGYGALLSLLAGRPDTDASRVVWIGFTPAELAEIGDWGIPLHTLDVECLHWRSPGPASAVTDSRTETGQNAAGESAASVYDIIVIKEPEQELDALVVFGEAYRLLSQGGRLLMLQGPEGRPMFGERYRALAQRCGFQVAETVILPEPHACRHCSIFTKITAPRWRVSHIQPADLPGLRGLFRQCFHHDISAGLWQWKYGQGRGRGAVVWSGARPVGHYGIISRRVRYFDRPARCWQVADVMVAPSERGAMARQGPFFLAAASCADVYVGHDRRHLIGMGFPNARHMRLAGTLGLYACVGGMVEIRWEPGNPRASLHLQCRDLRTSSTSNDETVVDELWNRMSRDLRDAVVGVRDWDYLNYRYRQHPEINYEILMITNRWLRRPLGIVVLNDAPEHCELLDIIAPLNNIPTLVDAARRRAARHGGKGLFAWITAQHAHRFEQTGGVRRPLDVSIPTSVWTPGPDPEQMKNRWWLMSGDTDFH